MRTNLIKALALAAMFVAGAQGVSAQGFLNKLTKGLDKVSKAADKVGDAAEVMDEATTKANNDSVAAKKAALLNAPQYKVNKVIQTDANGNPVLNEDGTTRYTYLVTDNEGKVCDATVAKNMVNSRLKAYGNIIAKFLGGVAGGGVKGLLSGNKKDAIIGGVVGGAAGLALSANDIKTIKGLNKSLKELKKTLEVYQTNFTEEGLPKDASMDLSNVEGIDFTKCEELTKSAADVKAELAASVANVSTSDMDFDI